MGASCGCGKVQPEPPASVAPPPPEPAPPVKPPKRPSLQAALERYELADESAPGSEHRVHRCTDCSCCLLFLAAVAAFVLITVYAKEHGDTRKLHHGLDYHGNICGVDAAVADKPFLYWCPDSPEDAPGGAAAPAGANTSQSLSEAPPLGLGRRLREEEARAAPGAADAEAPAQSGGAGGAGVAATGSKVHEWLARAPRITLNLRYPMCVDRCPGAGGGTHKCFRKKSPVEKKIVDERTGSFEETQLFKFGIVEDYPTMRVAHYCLPSDLGTRRSLGGILDDSQEALMFHLSEVRHAYPAVLAAAGLAVVLGFAYLFLLGLCPGCLILLTFAGAVLLPLLAGGVSLWGWYMEDQQQEFLEQHQELKLLQLPATGDGNRDLLVSGALIALGLLIALVGCCNLSAIRLSVRSVDAACECLLAVPSLLFEPFLHVAFQLGALVLLAKGVVLLVSCGEVSHISHISLTFLQGVSRSFVYHDLEYLYLALYPLIALWVWEFAIAMEKFAIAHCTQLWYFAEYRNGRKFMPACALLQGICVGLAYHIGTLALGALCIPPFRLVHWLHSSFLRQRDGDEDRGNDVSECLVSCCTCCWACWEGFIKFMSSNAYIVVAIDSYPFFPASQKAYNADLYEIEQLGDPNGFMWIFQLWGLLVISGLCAAFTWFMTTTFDDFTSVDSPHYVENPVPITAIGGIIGLLIGITFMHVLRNIADTIVFCYALEREWHEDRGLPMRNNVPPSLEAYLSTTGLGSRTMTPGSSRRALMRTA